MKKYALILVVALLATPVFAATVTIVDNGDLTADIMYNNDGEDVAAYALDLTVDAGAIVEVNDFHVGVSVAGAAGYGIFPANFDRFITVNGQGDVDDWGVAGYTPVADVNDKGAAGGLGSSAITIELGALYKGDANKPAGSAKLCTITVSEGCNLTISENAIRGGIVLANAGAPSQTNLPATFPIGGDIDCFPASHPAYNDWVSLGKPDCWCISTHCKGDADGTKEGSAKAGYARVFIKDLNILIAAWNVKGDAILEVENGVCADFAYDKEGSAKAGFARVFINDLNILIANWNVKGALPDDCPGDIPPADL